MEFEIDDRGERVYLRCASFLGARLRCHLVELTEYDLMRWVIYLNLKLKKINEWAGVYRWRCLVERYFGNLNELVFE